MDGTVALFCTNLKIDVQSVACELRKSPKLRRRLFAHCLFGIKNSNKFYNTGACFRFVMIQWVGHVLTQFHSAIKAFINKKMLFIALCQTLNFTLILIKRMMLAIAQVKWNPDHHYPDFIKG